MQTPLPIILYLVYIFLFKMWYTVFSEKNFSGMLYKNAPHSEAEIERKLSAWERINYIA